MAPTESEGPPYVCLSHLADALHDGEYRFEVTDVVHRQLQLDEPIVTRAVLQLAATRSTLALLVAGALGKKKQITG